MQVARLERYIERALRKTKGDVLQTASFFREEDDVKASGKGTLAELAAREQSKAAIPWLRTFHGVRKLARRQQLRKQRTADPEKFAEMAAHIYLMNLPIYEFVWHFAEAVATAEIPDLEEQKKTLLEYYWENVDQYNFYMDSLRALIADVEGTHFRTAQRRQKAVGPVIIRNEFETSAPTDLAFNMLFFNYMDPRATSGATIREIQSQGLSRTDPNAISVAATFFSRFFPGFTFDPFDIRTNTVSNQTFVALGMGVQKDSPDVIDVLIDRDDILHEDIDTASLDAGTMQSHVPSVPLDGFGGNWNQPARDVAGMKEIVSWKWEGLWENDEPLIRALLLENMRMMYAGVQLNAIQTPLAPRLGSDILKELHDPHGLLTLVSTPETVLMPDVVFVAYLALYTKTEPKVQMRYYLDPTKATLKDYFTAMKALATMTLDDKSITLDILIDTVFTPRDPTTLGSTVILLKQDIDILKQAHGDPRNLMTDSLAMVFNKFVFMQGSWDEFSASQAWPRVTDVQQALEFGKMLVAPTDDDYIRESNLFYNNWIRAGTGANLDRIIFAGQYVDLHRQVLRDLAITKNLMLEELPAPGAPGTVATAAPFERIDIVNPEGVPFFTTLLDFDYYFKDEHF